MPTLLRSQKTIFKTPASPVSWSPYAKVWVEIKEDKDRHGCYVIRAFINDEKKFNASNPTMHWEHICPESIAVRGLDQAKAIALIWFQNRESWLNT
jgi:hypothetical protein